MKVPASLEALFRPIMRAVLIGVSALCLSHPPAAARPVSPGQADAPLPAPSTRPGTLLDYKRMQLPAFYRAKAWRILYVTRDYRLRPILSTGMVVLPDKAPRIPMERRFVAWAHPTYGVARKCAPSLRGSPVKAISGLNELVAAGTVVAATDYPGLGTEGPIGYLVGKGQAYAVLDSLRAAKQIPGVGGGPDFALWGYSQGGHAALFAADLASSYAPEMRLKGVAAVAPPTDLVTLLRANLGTVPGRILLAFTLSSWNMKYGAPLNSLVGTGAAGMLAEVSRSCIDDTGGKIDALSAQKNLSAQFLKADPARVRPWGDLMMQNSKFSLSARIPALIIQGDSDDLVRPAVTTQFVRASCKAGVPVNYVVLKGAGHGGAIASGTGQAVNWLAARLKGESAKSNCR